MKSLLDLTEKDSGVTPRKVASASGGEYAGPCPVCGGSDRFRIWQSKGRFWCRGCGIQGDAIQYLRDVRGMSYPDACRELGVEVEQRSSGCRQRTDKPIWTPKEAENPPSEWQNQAVKLVEWAAACLWSDAGKTALEWLKNERGLTEETIRAARIGWNSKDIWRDRKAWGLPEALNDKGKPKRLWIPAGLVIPFLHDGKVHRVRVRRADPGDGQRYIVLPGSSNAPMVWGDDCKAFMILESELDGVLLHQEAGELTGVIALGSASSRPDVHTTELLRNTEQILVALDGDDAGAKNSWQWWPEHFNRARRWPPVSGKDPGEMRQAGIDVRTWVEAGLQPKPKQTEESKQPEQMGETGDSRQATRDRLLKVYSDQAAHYTGDDYRRAASVPGWAARLQELEDAFTAVWQSVGDPAVELEALAAHWRAGLKGGSDATL
jgi:DNA primase